MKRFIKYLEEHPLDFQQEDSRYLVEYFGDYYRSLHPIENDAIWKKLQSLEPIMKSMSLRRKKKLFHTVLELCDLYEKAAFF